MQIETALKRKPQSQLSGKENIATKLKLTQTKAYEIPDTKIEN